VAVPSIISFANRWHLLHHLLLASRFAIRRLAAPQDPPRHHVLPGLRNSSITNPCPCLALDHAHFPCRSHAFQLTAFQTRASSQAFALFNPITGRAPLPALRDDTAHAPWIESPSNGDH